MDGWQQKMRNYIEYLKTNRYSLFFIGAIAVLIIIIIAMIVITVNVSKNKSPNSKSPSQTVSQAPGTKNIPSAQPALTITTPDPTQAAVIENQTQPQISPNVAVPYTVSEIRNFGSDWAIITITNPNIGVGLVIVKKINGSWKVVLGPGTYFDPQQMQSIAAPQSLIDNLYPPSSPSPSIIPNTTPYNSGE